MKSLLRPKVILLLLTVWAILQIPRFIALPLINSVLSKQDPAAWLFPAIIDIVVAVLAPLVIYFVWKHPNLWTWLFILNWLVISTFDHASAITAFSIAGVPTIFKEFGSSGNIVPAIQSIIDGFLFWALCQEKVRTHFFTINNKSAT